MPFTPLLSRTARPWTLLAIASVSLLAGSCTHTPADRAGGGWRPLFDGTSKDGWEMTGPGELKLEDGVLATHGGMGLLYYTRERLGDCQIRVVFKLTGPKDNSGVFVRIPDRPPDPWFAVNHGYEIQIDNNGDDYHRIGCLYSLSKARNVVQGKVGEWNTFLITLRGPRTVVELNGALVTDFKEGDSVPDKKVWYEPDRGLRPNLGYIGLQNHDDTAHVQFKEVSVRPLP